MIRLAMDADALAATRFALSPLMQAGAALHPHASVADGRHRLSGAVVRRVVAGRRLHLIAAVRSHVGAYVPDFMTPGTAAGPRPDLTAELHRVATTPADVVARQLGRMLDGTDGRTGRTPPSERVLRRFLERGERDFAERMAREMHVFWESCLAPLWPALRARAEADLEARARHVAGAGLGEALSSLHPAIAYRAGSLRLCAERRLDVRAGGGLLLFPSPLARSWLLSVDPWRERGPYLIYPAGAPGPAAARSPAAARGPAARDRDGATGGRVAAGPATACPATDGPAGSLGSLVGPARLQLLADLALPRTTTELARRHQLSASTVSYHLSRLHRAGLVTRTRQANRVYYERSGSAAVLLDEGADTPGAVGGEPRAGVLSA
ncbi:helix-turn-helix domain-containing protein [Streptomyces sp. NPDC030392]|uniref:ArsR/SmtB family transcription factor n=1 Tax=Streptomyces sp. NPDC030392 TaxID=3155468 RepID=UPI0033D0AB16